MRELARRAGFGTASLYTYFSGRDEVLAVIGMEGLKQLGAYLEAVRSDLPHIERLVEYGVAYLAFAREHPERFALVFETLTVPVESWEELCEEAWPFTILIDGFWGAVDAGALISRRGLTPDAMAYGLWALVQGIATLKQRHLANIGGDIEEMDRAVVEHYITGL
jgi:AcrR family transcriptional regulator